MLVRSANQREQEQVGEGANRPVFKRREITRANRVWKSSSDPPGKGVSRLDCGS